MMRFSLKHRFRAGWAAQSGWIVLGVLYCLIGCVMVGPNFSKPSSAVEKQWMESKDSRVNTTPPHYKDWWQGFKDRVLTRLIDVAYRENLQLQITGVRVLQARAQLGIAVGEWYPQTQQAFGALTQYGIGSRVSGTSSSGSSSGGSTAGQSSSSTAPSGGSQSLSFKESELGATASWEVDFWGKFRRGIESAQMSLLASVAAYDSALVTLTADVAANYVTIRTLQERLRIANENVKTQSESLRIVRSRFEAGAVSDRDVQQAIALLNSTQSTIPQLEIQLQQSLNALSTLLGRPPAQLDDLITGPAGIPTAPVQVAVGIPVDLLRRRPDIRNAEYLAAAQSAQIGYAKADLYPAFSLSGTFEVLATNLGNASLGDMFSWKNRYASVGPSFTWNIFNYGRIINNVRLQDALFQELLLNYRNVVLTAQQEVESALVSFLRSQDQAALLAKAVAAARRSVALVTVQYRQGAVDYTSVLTAQQTLLSYEDSLAITQGAIPQGLINVYRALGGGWQIRLGNPFVPANVREEMTQRTSWGDLFPGKPIPVPNLQQPPLLPPPPQW